MKDSNDPRDWRIWHGAARNVLFFMILLLGLLFVAQWLGGAPPLEKIIPYSQLQQELASGHVERVVVSDQRVSAYLKKPDTQGAQVLSAERIEPNPRVECEGAGNSRLSRDGPCVGGHGAA